jgi:hypothetical protein
MSVPRAAQRGVIRFNMLMPKAGTLIFAVLVLVGCRGLLEADARKEIAFSTIYDANGQLDAHVFAGALSIKFPPKTSPSELEHFVVSLGGKCVNQTTETLICTIPQTVTICLATYINIIVGLSNGTISNIQARPKADGC